MARVFRITPRFVSVPVTVAFDAGCTSTRVVCADTTMLEKAVATGTSSICAPLPAKVSVLPVTLSVPPVRVKGPVTVAEGRWMSRKPPVCVSAAKVTAAALSNTAWPDATRVSPGWAYADSTVTAAATSMVPAPVVVEPACSVLLLPSRTSAPAFTVTLPPIAFALPLSRSSPASTTRAPVLVSVLPCVVVPVPVLRSVPLFRVRML